ncbi:MAG: nicotinamide riboside transporter PnuC [Lacibacter sp.]|jgi:nicotinamide mononucleotide transporter
MSLAELVTQFIAGMKATTWPEYLAVFAGIASVWFSRRENIWVYPVGLINTTIYIWLSYKGQLLGEASVNLYYTIMSIYGWWQWARRTPTQEHVLHIRFSDARWWRYQLLFFAGVYAVLFGVLTKLQQGFAPDAIPWADAFASATAFTGMWLMTRKKVESWYWWMATNLASIPLYFVKHYVFTSVFYFVLLLMAISGWREWRRRALQTTQAHANG